MSDTTQDTIHVVVAMDFSDDILTRLREVSPRLRIERHYPEVPESVWASAEVLYTLRHFPEPAQAPLLRWIQLHSAGVEHALARPIVRAEDVEVTSASGIHATQIAQYSLMMMLAFNYRLLKMVELKQKIEWPQRAHEVFNPHNLRGQTLGIVGYGSIGRELARLAEAIGMTVLATKRDPMHPAEEDEYTEEGTGDPSGEIPERLYPGEALASMARECDYLVVTLPLTEKTRHTVNTRVLEAMKSSAVLVNIGRGGVVDEAALINALAAKHIRGAALDVFEEEPLPATSPLWNLDNVIISPHISGNISDYNERGAALFIENLRRYLSKQPLLNKVKREAGY